jgi:hypothetical protein
MLLRLSGSYENSQTGTKLKNVQHGKVIRVRAREKIRNYEREKYFTFITSVKIEKLPKCLDFFRFKKLFIKSRDY